MGSQNGTAKGHRPTPSSGSTPGTTVSDPFAANFGSIHTSSRRNSFADTTPRPSTPKEPKEDPIKSVPRRPTMTHQHTSSTMSNTSAASSFPNPMMAFDQKFNLPSSDSIPQSGSELPQNLNVLVVDDDEITRRMMTRMFQRLKSRVSVAENGQVAVQMILGPDWSPVTEGPGSVRFVQDEPTVRVLQPPVPPPPLQPSSSTSTTPPASPIASSLHPREDFDIVFMDNQMPVLSGLQAVKMLREMGRKDYIIGLTGMCLLFWSSARLSDSFSNHCRECLATWCVASWFHGMLLYLVLTCLPDQEEFLNAGVDVYVSHRFACVSLLC
jgi:CheY-like chemotaxis protein